MAPRRRAPWVSGLTRVGAANSQPRREQVGERADEPGRGRTAAAVWIEDGVGHAERLEHARRRR